MEQHPQRARDILRVGLGELSAQVHHRHPLARKDESAAYERQRQRRKREQACPDRRGKALRVPLGGAPGENGEYILADAVNERSRYNNVYVERNIGTP